MATCSRWLQRWYWPIMKKYLIFTNLQNVVALSYAGYKIATCKCSGFVFRKVNNVSNLSFFEVSTSLGSWSSYLPRSQPCPCRPLFINWDSEVLIFLSITKKHSWRVTPCPRRSRWSWASSSLWALAAPLQICASIRPEVKISLKFKIRNSLNCRPFVQCLSSSLYLGVFALKLCSTKFGSWFKYCCIAWYPSHHQN